MENRYGSQMLFSPEETHEIEHNKRESETC